MSSKIFYDAKAEITINGVPITVNGIPLTVLSEATFTVKSLTIEDKLTILNHFRNQISAFSHLLIKEFAKRKYSELSQNDKDFINKTFSNNKALLKTLAKKELGRG